MSEASVMQGLGQLLGSVVTTSNQMVQSAFPVAYGGITKYGRSLPHSRAQESEADHIGLIYMARAGYEPRSAVDFWQRFSSYNQQQGGSIAVPEGLGLGMTLDEARREFPQRCCLLDLLGSIRFAVYQ